ncbi:MAG: phage baseplate upper protein [Oscillospiraceae bacterium]|nr:phage baseplate upper protein [Oscillospiraceae bacterium]
MQYIKEITVDLSGEMYFSYITAVQGDEGSRYVKITILSNGEVFEIPDGAIATLRCRKPDGTYILNDATINDDYTITAELTENMLAAVGNCRCEVTVYADDASLTTVPFIVKVTAVSVNPDIESTDEYTALTEALNKVIDISGIADEALAEASEALETVSEVETEIGTAIANAEDATEAANEAAEKANTSANNADEATAKANTATENANTATEEAKTATEQANTATDNANNATEAANEAADKANTAATNADEAAEACELATEGASTNAKAALIASLDGTLATYKDVMRKWFLISGVNAVSDTGLTALVDEWYSATRPGEWIATTEFYQPDVSAVTYGTKGGDHADLTCTPSTDTVKGQDDYEGLPLFAITDCNFYVDADTLRPVITAIDGITDNFKRYDPTVYVGVLQMSAWTCRVETDDTYTRVYSANSNVPYPVKPLAEAVDPDGNFRQWVLHVKYLSHTTDGLMTACAGLIPTAWTSESSLITLAHKNGTQYSGTTSADDAFLKIMVEVKYASLTLDGIVQGCVNLNYQYPAQVSETGVQRIILTTANAANLEVGMSVIVGYYNSSASSPLDRGTAAIYSTSTNTGCLITAIESVTIDDTEYSAVYVDLDSFDTTANGTATEGTTYISTWHWITGSTDCVLGNDGSPKSCTSGKYPAKIQGIEIMNGGYEVISDVILKLYQDEEDESVYYYEPYVVKSSANLASSITANYIATGIILKQPSSDGWNYIKKLGESEGVMFPIEIGGSSSTYTRDAIYMNSNATGIREWLARANLNNGSGTGGLSGVHGNHGVSSATWHIVARNSVF